jgi:hypothetical protein
MSGWRRFREWDGMNRLAQWLRANLTWDRVLGIVSLVTGIIAAIFFSVEKYFWAELCVVLSAILVAIWAITQLNYVWGRIVFVVTVGIASIIVYSINSYDANKERERAERITYNGYLTPANDAGPTLPKAVPPNSLQLLLGDDLRIIMGNIDTPILTFRGEPFLSILIKNNEMKLSTTVTDSNNHDIVRIIDNEFQAFAERSFNPRQPDAHSLYVRDAKGKEVLNIHFINDKTIRIVGRFYIPGKPKPIVIDPLNGFITPDGGGVGHMTIITSFGGGFYEFQ